MLIPSAIKNEEISPLLTTWMDLEYIMLSEMSDRERQISLVFVIQKKKIKTNRLIEKEIKLAVTRGEERVGEGKLEEDGQKLHSSIYKTNKDLKYNMMIIINTVV